MVLGCQGSKNHIVFVVILWISASVYAADYYVAQNGNDSNNGSEGSPFRTIQMAANTMVSGDKCFIKEGTYREKVTVPTNDLSFEAYSNDVVIISGAEQITGWTQH